jgi:hypothetical protein
MANSLASPKYSHIHKANVEHTARHVARQNFRTCFRGRSRHPGVHVELACEPKIHLYVTPAHSKLRKHRTPQTHKPPDKVGPAARTPRTRNTSKHINVELACEPKNSRCTAKMSNTLHATSLANATSAHIKNVEHTSRHTTHKPSEKIWLAARAQRTSEDINVEPACESKHQTDRGTCSLGTHHLVNVELAC